MHMHPSRGKTIASIVLIVLAIVFLVGLLVLLVPPVNPQGQHHSDPAQNPAYQPYRTVQACLDTPPLYPSPLFHQAAGAIADRIDQAVTANSGGLAFYLTEITSQSFQNDVLSFSVPAVAAYPSPPSPPRLTDDPYKNAALKQAYQQALLAWQQTIRTQQHNLALLQAKIKGETNTLRSLTPVVDPVADDIYGCLQEAQQHFHAASGEKVLLIASSLSNNTLLQATNRIDLTGVSVRIIFHTCVPPVAAICQANDLQWKQLFLQSGAKSVAFYDPAQEAAVPVTF